MFPGGSRGAAPRAGARETPASPCVPRLPGQNTKSPLPSPSSHSRMAVAAKQRKRTNPSPPTSVVAEARRGGRRAAPVRWDTLKSILGAVVIFLFIRTFLVEAFHIPSGSMEPTLLVGDFLFVNKAIYGEIVFVTNRGRRIAALVSAVDGEDLARRKYGHDEDTSPRSSS